MGNLTSKQEKYVQGLVSGLSQREAFRKAYPKSKEWKDSSVDSNASTALRNTKVAQRYKELMDEHKDKALWTREEAVNTLKWLVKQSIISIEEHDEGYVRQGTSGALLGAIKELNELELLYPLHQKQVDKINADLKTESPQEDKLSEYLKLVQKAVAERE